MSRSKSMWTSAKQTVDEGRELRVNERTISTDGTVESSGSTATDAIFSEGLNSAYFNSFVASESREVLAGKIESLFSCVDEFWSGTICTGDYRDRC